MQDGDASLRNISDTALWVAAYRARETRRPDAVFRDPFAERLAGQRGQDIAARLSPRHRQEWAFIARTWLYDRLIAAGIDAGADTVVNLAAGLDTRPYRMDLPSDLRWIEVDLPPVLQHKETALEAEQPVCALERVPLDLSDGDSRRALFDRVAGSSQSTLIVTEGLIIYLPRQQVAELAQDLAARPPFRQWAMDIVSPGLMRMMDRQNGAALREAGAPFRFAPEEGLDFYRELGWVPEQKHSLFEAGGQLRRLPFPLNLFALLPQPKQLKPNAIWSMICLLTRA